MTLRVFEEEGRLVAEVIDDGKGFVFEDVESGTRGLGLLGMRERAGSVGRRVSVSSELGEGTRIRLEVPVNVLEAVDQARTLCPDVVLMDLSMHLGDRAVLPDDERRFVIGLPVAHVPAHILPGEHETALRLNSCQQKRQPRG